MNEREDTKYAEKREAVASLFVSVNLRHNFARIVGGKI